MELKQKTVIMFCIAVVDQTELKTIKVLTNWKVVKMKTVKKILEYQKVIMRLLQNRGYDVVELEDICLCRIGHIACWESFEHAIKDLLVNGTVKSDGHILFLKT